MLNKKYKDSNIILASKSPRRQNLLKELNLEFSIRTKEGIEEIYPKNVENKDVAEYLAELKADAFKNDLKANDILITADTVVILKDRVINKPANKEEAFEMLKSLSGNKHRVITGVCITSKEKKLSFSAFTDVYFRELKEEEINFYIEKYKPFDKAGAYGIQEWIGYIGIEKIEGSYFNVMGLPIQKLYDELMLYLLF
jgi:septum formation protein